MSKEVNTMQRDPLLYGVIGVLIGGVVVWFLASQAVNTSNAGMMRMMGMYSSQNRMMDADKEQEESNTGMHTKGMGMSMDDMMSGLEGKTGDEFDQTFLSEMIDHHQGAINMAKLALQNAKHDEIKNLAEDIISAQTKEINEMKQWQKTWGY